MTSAVQTGGKIRLTAASAWYEYLCETKILVGEAYAEVEPWAWARLKGRLRYVKRRDKVVKS